jgi:hypothetical protein
MVTKHPTAAGGVHGDKWSIEIRDDGVRRTRCRKETLL